MAIDQTNIPQTQTVKSASGATDTAPTIFFEGLEGFMFNASVAKMNAVEIVMTGAGEQPHAVQQRTVAHLVFPLPVLAQIHDWLGKQLTHVREQSDRIAQGNGRPV